MSSTTANVPFRTGPPCANEAMRPLPWRAAIGYGTGDASNNVAFTTSLLPQVYYMNVMGISAAAIGTMMDICGAPESGRASLSGFPVGGARWSRC